MAQLEIFKDISHHCESFDEFDYLWELAQTILCDSDYECFMIHCLAYFSLHYFSLKKSKPCKR